MNIPVSKLEELVNNLPALDALVAATTNKIDDGVLGGAKTALKLLSDNKHLLNLACNYLNLPVTFTATPEGGVPKDLAGIDGITDLKTVLLECDCDDKDCDDGDCCE